MPDKNKYNLSYRPPAYFDTATVVIANIKGQYRRQKLKELIEAGDLEEIDEWLVKWKLSDDERQASTMVHPMYMGGEYLPDYRLGEVEIARVSLESVTSDVISIRARPHHNKIHYRIVGEYETRFRFKPRETDEPLTMGELIALLDGASGVFDEARGFTDAYRNYSLENGSDLKSLLSFVTISSEFYPELGQWYRDQADEWYYEKFRELVAELSTPEEWGNIADIDGDRALMAANDIPDLLYKCQALAHIALAIASSNRTRAHGIFSQARQAAMQFINSSQKREGFHYIREIQEQAKYRAANVYAASFRALDPRDPSELRRFAKRAMAGQPLILLLSEISSEGKMWQFALRLSANKAGQLEVWQSNAEPRPRFVKQKTIPGLSPWRELLTYLAGCDIHLCPCFKKITFASASGVEQWQATALLICWFRDWDSGEIHPGARLAALSDDKMAILCGPYPDFEGVKKLWADLTRLEELTRKNPKVHKLALAETVDVYGCWSADNPLQGTLAKIDQEEAEFIDNVVPAIAERVQDLIAKAILAFPQPRSRGEASVHERTKGEIREYIHFFYRETGRFPLGLHRISGREVDFGGDLLD